LIDRLMIP